MSSLKVYGFFHHGKKSKSMTNLHDEHEKREKPGSLPVGNILKPKDQFKRRSQPDLIDEHEKRGKSGSFPVGNILKPKDRLERRSQPELIDHFNNFNNDVSANANEKIGVERVHRNSETSSEHSLAACIDYLDCTSEHDETDGSALANQQIEKLRQKIEKTKKQIIHLQAVRKANVTEYLNTTGSSVETNAKLKHNFERSNQKTNTSIQVLQRKLEKYQQHVRSLEDGVQSSKTITKSLEDGVQSSKTIIKAVQDSVRSSITDAVSKPLESLNNFKIRSRKEKRVSAESGDMIYFTVTDEEEIDNSLDNSHLATSDDESISSPSSDIIRSQMLEKFRQRSGNANNNDKIDLLKSRVGKLEKENEDLKQTVDQLKESLSHAFKSLQDESYKTKQLKVQFNDIFNQWNDLTELHQNEMRSMKNEMDQTLEHIERVEYRFVERTNDLEEDIENCVTNISKIEKQQDEQTINYLLDMNAKMLLSKFLGFLINICVFVIFIINSLRKFITPFVSDRSRLVASGIAILAIIIIWKSYISIINLSMNGANGDNH